MKSLCFFAFRLCWFMVFTVASDFAWAKNELVLAVGESEPLKMSPSQPILVSSRSVLKLQARGHQFLMTGLKVGVAHLTSGSQKLTVHVLTPLAAKTARILQNWIKDRRGLELKIHDSQIILDGRLLLTQDWSDLATEIPEGAGYSMQAQIEPETQTEIQKILTRTLKSSQLPNLSFVTVGRFRALLPKDFEASRNKIQAVFAKYGVEVELDDHAVALEPLVRVQILVTEVRKQFFRRLGVQWPVSVEASLLPVLRPPGVSSDILVQLHALEEDGGGKILASPKILCRSGKEANFFAGGEFPIKIANFKQHDVIWKKYGILLQIKPKADRSGRVSLGIETEVSSIDGAHIVDGIPGILANRISSHFDLEKSQTVALSGLLKTENGDASSGLPGLKSLPILGSLFSSRDFRENRTELVVFVTPEVLNDERGINDSGT